MKISILCVLVLLLTTAGCVDPGDLDGGGASLLSEDSPADSAAFLDRLSSQPTVSEAQAFRGVLMMMGKDEPMSFAEAVETLRGTKVVDKDWDFQPDRPITRGKLAYMFYQSCGIRGGLTLSFAGPSRRYCLRELQYRGLMAPGLPHNRVTGMEYVAVLTRADELLQTGEVSRVLTRQYGP